MTPAIVSTLARAAGLPGWLADGLGQVPIEAVIRLLDLLRRYQAGEPLERIVRAEPPDPIGALQRVDEEDEGKR